MKVAILHGSNMGFFPRFYKNLLATIESDAENMVRLFVPDSGQNRKCMLPNQIVFGTRINWHVHHLLYKWTGKRECWSHFSTLDLIRKLKVFQPDIIHMHVINQCQINIPLLVRYINQYQIPVVWTFHDCRVFTGGCPYFDEIGCDEWEIGCKKCPLKTIGGNYGVGDTKWQWRFNKKWCPSIHNLTIVTPSNWLIGFVQQSFFKDIPSKVIYNGVDIKAFNTATGINVRKQFELENKKIILGCAINWETRKGLHYFERLPNLLPKNYQIVLVGGIKEWERNELAAKGIITIGKTKSFVEMVAWYQSADVFVNPTLADNFPTVNIESLASGTPVVTFDTGGSPEALDNSCGIVVPKNDLLALANAIIEITNHKEIYSAENCIRRSQLFTNDNYKEYIKIYTDKL